MAIKLCHFAQFAPHRCGLYGTARDLIKAERIVGYDAGMVDARLTENPTIAINGVIEDLSGKSDGFLKPMPPEWANDADIFVRHSFVPQKFKDMNKPIIGCMHGRPENTFLLESYGKNPVWSTFFDKDKGESAFVTFWPEYLDILSMIMKGKVYYVPAMVDLMKFRPEGEKRDFKELNGRPNILIADIWREDVTPFNLIFAAHRFIKKYAPQGKIHILAIPSTKKTYITKMLDMLNKQGVLGIVLPIVNKIEEFYRASDFVITPHNIATRVVRESLACGCPIVAGTGNKFTPFVTDSRDVNGFSEKMNECWQRLQKTPADKWGEKWQPRKIAERNFNLKRAGEAMKIVVEEVLKKPKSCVAIKQTYKEYVEHQKSKLNEKPQMIEQYHREYRNDLGKFLNQVYDLKGKSVLCLGARTGAEVQAFIDNGAYANGIDLNPGAGNRFVVTGDFHGIQYAAESVDYVFTNSLDHVFDMDKVLSEIYRVLKPDGKLLVDFQPDVRNDKWASFKWKDFNEFQEIIKKSEYSIDRIFDRTFMWFKKHISFSKIPKLKLALIYDPACPKLQKEAYSQSYRDMFLALAGRFDTSHIRADYDISNLDTDVIFFYDIHSDHKVNIKGVKEHPAVKFEYFNDPWQKTHNFRYPNGKEVLKLGAIERCKRAQERGIDRIVCPYEGLYKKFLAPYIGEEKLLWLPVSPSPLRFADADRPFVDRKREIPLTGHLWQGDDDFKPYEFRRWAVKQNGALVVQHTSNSSTSGLNYGDFLSQYIASLALCDTHIVPKYFEIPMAGCLCIAQKHEEYEKLGFENNVSCVFVDEHNYVQTLEKVKNEPENFEEIAGKGKELVDSKYTSKHFADKIYDEVKKWQAK